MPVVWKQLERDVATWMRRPPGSNAARIPSGGRPQADVADQDYTIEAKSRATTGFPAWLRQAFDQRRVNDTLYPEKTNLVLVGEHYGRGRRPRWYLMTEVDPKVDEFEGAVESLMAARENIERALEGLFVPVLEDTIAEGEAA